MPIYMDRHDVSSEVTAEIVADLHQKDLKIQDKFNCKGLTYWFDYQRKTAFCLVEAPDKAAIKQMHDQAHGEVPNRIIEVDKTVVESFLGRIQDPEEFRNTTLNIINDPAFRTIMVLGVRPVCYNNTLSEKSSNLLEPHHRAFGEVVKDYQGSLVKQTRDHLLVSFDAVSRAISCAVAIARKFSHEAEPGLRGTFELKIGLDAGVPVDEKEGLFENTIKSAQAFFRYVKGTIILSSELHHLYESESQQGLRKLEQLVVLRPKEEKFLKELLNFSERALSNPSLKNEELCRHLGYSKSRLYRKMVSLTGKSPNGFFKDYRLNKALQLLTGSEMNISEVAFETGFSSPAYFSKCFHGTFGMLPSQYLSINDS